MVVYFTAQDLARLIRGYRRLERESLKWSERRAALPAGSSRARVTTANARWAQAAEAREQVRRQLEAAGVPADAFDGERVGA